MRSIGHLHLALDEVRYRGKVETSAVDEQGVAIKEGAGQTLRLRRDEVHLDHPTEDGDSTIRLLPNLPKSHFTTHKIARLYRHRWQIESLFQRLESALQSEIASGPSACGLAGV